MIVIDASVAIKWFVLEERREKALEVLQTIKKSPAEFAVPDLFYLEMMSVLTRLLKRKVEVRQVVDDLYGLGMIQVRHGAKLLKLASDLAIDNNLSGYDAVYAACASSIGAEWLTADRKAQAKVPGVSRIL